MSLLTSFQVFRLSGRSITTFRWLIQTIVIVNVKQRVPRLETNRLDKIDDFLRRQISGNSADHQVLEVCICHWLISEPKVPVA
jgi:hypothetical protein